MNFTRFGLLLVLLLSVFFPFETRTQSSAAKIEILDRAERLVTSIVDGNRIRLRVILPARVEAETRAEFLLNETPVGACAVQADEDSCVTESIETLGWYWAEGGAPSPLRRIQLRVGGEARGEATVSVEPRPVVFIHGMISNASRFNQYVGADGFLASIGLTGYTVGDGQFEGAMNMGNPLDPTARTFTIAENATQVDKYLDGVLRATGAEQADLIAHSMGGLVTRYYLDRLMTEDDVAQVILLGTPNGGSPCGGLLSTLDFFMPATLELHPSYINEIFNKQITNTRGVPVHAVAGSLITDPSISPCSSVPTDSTVSLASVQAIPLHLAGMIPLEHNFLPSEEEVFAQFVRPLLQAAPHEFAAFTSEAALPAAETGQFTKTYAGHLSPDNETRITIHIDPNVAVASFGLYDSTRTLQVSVQGASGKTLELDLENKGIVIDDPETLLYLGYGFENPKPGAWVVTLTTTESTPASGAEYAVYAQFTGGAKLTAQADELAPEIGQTVNLSVALEGAQIESAQARIVAPDGSRQTLELTRGGDLFRAAFAPSQAGLHGIEITVTGKTGDGFIIDRAAFLSVEAQPKPQSPILTWAMYVGLILLVLSPLLLILGAALKRKNKK